VQTITVFSDFICPFCYVAERGPLAELVRNNAVEIDWRGFEVHPEIPRGGSTAEVLFGTERFEQGKAYILELAELFHVQLNFPNHIPNSMRALAMTEWARSYGKLEPLKDLLMDMYWLEGVDLEDDDVLRSAARQVGLCPARALNACEMSEWELRVVQNRTMGYGQGVSGVPTFLSEHDRVVGCQPVEILQRLLR
jgi:predicted DsbA family dithiol-disulfide isomerase